MSEQSSRDDLGKRERQIMDIVYRRGRASAQEVLADLPDPPTYSSVRAMLRYLEDKGHLKHTTDGPRYVYSPVVPRAAARDSALSQVLKTFFDGSTGAAVAALGTNRVIVGAIGDNTGVALSGGAYLLSSSSGVNRIKGGSVQIN